MDTDSLIFSVVIPAYNYAETLGRAVDSVIPQLSATSELIIIDDGSTDDTPRVIHNLAEQYPRRFLAHRKVNGGLASVRNKGIELAKGRYLIFLDADDEMEAGALELLRAHLDTYPTTRFIVGGHLSVKPDGTIRRHFPGVLPGSPAQRLRAYLLDKSISLANGACAMHRDIFSMGNYPERFRSAEDVPVFAQALANFPCTVINSPLARIHKHDDSLRHDLAHAKSGGVALVDEVFSPNRLGPECQVLRREYYVQRCLSLFRSAYLNGDSEMAREYYWRAIRADWRVLSKVTYTRKALRLALRR